MRRRFACFQFPAGCTNLKKFLDRPSSLIKVDELRAIGQFLFDGLIPRSAVRAWCCTIMWILWLSLASVKQLWIQSPLSSSGDPLDIVSSVMLTALLRWSNPTLQNTFSMGAVELRLIWIRLVVLPACAMDGLYALSCRPYIITGGDPKTWCAFYLQGALLFLLVYVVAGILWHSDLQNRSFHAFSLGWQSRIITLFVWEDHYKLINCKRSTEALDDRGIMQKV